MTLPRLTAYLLLLTFAAAGGASGVGNASSIPGHAANERVRSLEGELARAREQIETLWAEHGRLAGENARLARSEAAWRSRAEVPGSCPQSSPGVAPAARRSAARPVSPPKRRGEPALPGAEPPRAVLAALPLSAAPLARMVPSSPFGPRNGRFHHGVDLRAAHGTPVFATGPGRVVHVGWRAALGRTVEVDHGGGVLSRYAHLSAATVAPGAEVVAGQAIGKVGSSGRATGPHLHYEVEYRGRTIDPAAILGGGVRQAAALRAPAS